MNKRKIKDKDLYIRYKELDDKANDMYIILKKIKDYCKEQNLKYDTTACDILNIIEEGINEN